MNAATRLALATALACMLASAPVTALVDRQSWVGSALVAVALVVGVGMLGRSRHVPAVGVVLAQLVILGEWLVIRFAGDVAPFGFVPTGDALAAVASTLVQGFETIQAYAAPVPADPGITLIVAGGIGLVAVVVDALVGRGGHRSARVAWTGLPLMAPFALTVALLPDGVGVPTFCLVVAGWLALVVSDSRVRVARWGRAVTLDPRRPAAEPQTSALAKGGMRIGAAALATAVVVPLAMPALPEGLLGGIGGPGGGAGQTIRTSNPIVDLRRDLVRPDNVEIFRYRTTDSSPEYIRTVVLDVFDGDVWRLSNREVPRSQRVDEGMPEVPGLSSLVEARTVTTDVSVSPVLASKWLPMPYPARQVAVEGDWRYDRPTLDVVTTGDDTRGISYQVTSFGLEPSPADLRAPRRDVRAVEPMLALPEDLSPAVAELAEEVTAATGTDDLSRAYALQEWFRSSGGFVYTLTRAPGTSSADLAEFLTERRGYCEQFAAAMAIMARSLNIPARVAVGYTPGSLQDDDTWQVRAHDAHAWPELYLGRVGWVRFEPTPAVRTGAPPAWTVPPVVDPDDASATPTAVPSAGPAEGPEVDPDAGLDAAVADESLAARIPWRLVLLLVAVAAVLALPAVAARVRRRLRWSAAADTAARADVAWTELREASQDAGYTWDPALTPRGVRDRLRTDAALDPDADESLGRVVTLAERARYAPEPGDTTPAALRADAQDVRDALLKDRPRRVRWRARWWPSATTDLWRRPDR